MRILITTGLSKRDVGGPFQYAPNLAKEFEKLGHKVKAISYGSVERMLPIGLRHLYFFLKILPYMAWADSTITLDTFSVGIPSLFAAKLFGRKVIVRIGGDFLWESYVERTGEKITLNDFNTKLPRLNLKERFISYFTKILIKRVDQLAFNTKWQMNIWQKAYDISPAKSYVVRNYVPEKVSDVGNIQNMKFLWAGRRIKLKNLELLKELSKEFEIEIVFGVSHLELQKRIKNCYAVILPSFSEVCPNFILEAVSYGKPFIMTEETGLKEIYNRGGIFVNPFDQKTIKEGILSMLDSQKYQKYKSEIESQKVERPWETVAREFLALCQ